MDDSFSFTLQVIFYRTSLDIRNSLLWRANFECIRAQKDGRAPNVIPPKLHMRNSQWFTDVCSYRSSIRNINVSADFKVWGEYQLSFGVSYSTRAIDRHAWCKLICKLLWPWELLQNFYDVVRLWNGPWRWRRGEFWLQSSPVKTRSRIEPIVKSAHPSEGQNLSSRFLENSAPCLVTEAAFEPYSIVTEGPKCSHNSLLDSYWPCKNHFSIWFMKTFIWTILDYSMRNAENVDRRAWSKLSWHFAQYVRECNVFCLFINFDQGNPVGVQEPRILGTMYGVVEDRK